MTDSPVLTVALLEALRERWIDRRLSVANELNPGLTDAELDGLEDRIGRPLGPELRCWWGWHNGVTRKASTPLSERDPGPWWISVEFAVERAAFLASLDEGEDLQGWNPSWLPVTRNISGGVLACECVSSSELTSSVRYVEPGISDLPPAVTAHSLGQVVSWWIELYDGEFYYFNAARGRWEVDVSNFDSFPGPEQLRTHYSSD